MLQDTVAVTAAAVDTIQVAADSLATAVGSQVGSQVTTLVALGLSVATKFAVDLAKKASTKVATLPDPVKALVAVAFAQAATWVSVKTGLLINPDISVLETTVAGLTVALSAMGVNAVTKTVLKK
jgi:hypothetical protein